MTAPDRIKRPGALRELSPRQSIGPNQPRGLGWLSQQCARKLTEFRQPLETVNRSLLGVPMRRPRRCLIRVEGLRRGLTIRCEDPRAFRLLPQQVRRRTCSASELKGNCDQRDKSKDQERRQASHRQSGTIASHQFRHFSPPSSPAKRRRSGGSSPRAAPTRQPGGVNTPGPYRPSANARTLNRQTEELATEWARSAAQPFGGARSSCDSDFAPGPDGAPCGDFFPGEISRNQLQQTEQ